MQRQNNEPSCCILFRIQEKLNWSLSGATAPIAIMLLIYTQEESCVSFHQPPNERGISAALHPISYVTWQQFPLEICPLLPYSHSCFHSKGHVALVEYAHSCTHSFLQHRRHECLWEEPHVPPQAAQPPIPIALSFSLAWAYLIFYFSNILCSKHLHAKLAFLPSLLSLSISPLWRGSAGLWTDAMSSTVNRAGPWFLQPR